MKIRYWIILLIFLITTLGIWWVSRDYRPSPKEGSAAPSFKLQDLNHHSVSLSDYRGKVVLINFWASWCGPCVAEMDSLEKLYQQLKGDKFEILAISVDEEGEKGINEFLKKNPVTFPILLDEELSVAEEFGTYRVPESYLIDTEGRVAEKILGARDWTDEKIIQKIKELLPKGAT